MVGEADLERRKVVAQLMSVRGEALVVTGLGSPTYDVHACGDRDDNYYLWGAMGSAALTGLGLAQAQPGKQVMVITGDGEQLMALGSLATISVASPDNLDIVVLDNQHYGETGMQSSHTARGVDIAAVAQACGFADSGTITRQHELDALCEQLQDNGRCGPRLYVVKIKPDNPPRSMPPRDATFIKNRFRQHLGLVPN